MRTRAQGENALAQHEEGQGEEEQPQGTQQCVVAAQKAALFTAGHEKGAAVFRIPRVDHDGLESVRPSQVFGWQESTPPEHSRGAARGAKKRPHSNTHGPHSDTGSTAGGPGTATTDPAPVEPRAEPQIGIHPTIARPVQLSKRVRTGTEGKHETGAPKAQEPRQGSKTRKLQVQLGPEEQQTEDANEGLPSPSSHQTAHFNLAEACERLHKKAAWQGQAPVPTPAGYMASNLSKEGFSDEQAEAELTRQFQKENFREMHVLGQFNKGFIVARHGSDLFVIDQHASDEKFNYETLQHSTELRTQQLIRPLLMDLTAAQELVVLDHLDVMHMNGFEFEVNEAAPPRQRLALKTIPYSRNTTFGVSDVHELISLLEERPGVICRPSRLNAMFASRACRMSLMIGTALDHTKMKRVLEHAATLEQPWNCPHGRPTMRHLHDMTPLHHQAIQEQANRKPELKNLQLEH